MPPLAFATACLLVAAVVLVPIPPRPTAALILAALLPTAAATVIRVRVITTAGSLFMSLTSYQVPIWSVLFGVLLLGEALPPQLFIALALILLGIAVSQSRAIGQVQRGRQRTR